MKRSILPLAIALAFSFTAVPADAALSSADKCEVFRAKTEMNFAKCLKVANLLEAKGKTGDRAKCVTKFDQGIAKAKTKFVNDKLNVTEAECSLNQEAVDAIKALDLVAAGVALADYGLDSGDLPLSQDIQDLIDDAVAGVDITSDNQAVCEAADGTWVLHGPEAGTCTPATVAARDCFREGACGVDGWNYGPYEGVTIDSTGCSDTVAGTSSYNFAISSQLCAACGPGGSEIFFPLYVFIFADAYKACGTAPTVCPGEAGPYGWVCD
jgi:hypothetical protein